MRTVAWCATAAVLAASLGVYAGIVVGERDAERSPVTAHLTPSESVACGDVVTLTADLAFDEAEELVVRLIRLDDEGREAVVRIEAAAAGSLEVKLPVPDADEGRHLVRVERRDELLALGTIAVDGCDASP
jgi:hypothetical protein